MNEAQKALFKEKLEPVPDTYDGCEFCNDIQHLDDIDETVCIAKYRDVSGRFQTTRYGICFDGMMLVYDIRYCPRCGTRLRRGRT